VHHPIDYARVVKAIGNEMDITLIDTLEDILPQVGISSADNLFCHIKQHCRAQPPAGGRHTCLASCTQNQHEMA
jgi:hypothetical protein